MTARCGGGTSGANPAFTAVVDITVQAIAAVLSARGLRWIIPAIPLLNLPPLTLSSFCSTDPPSMPTLTTAEASALLQIQLGADFDSGLAKFADAVQAIMWDQICICTSGALTAPPTLAQPANTPVPVPPSNVSSPCVTLDDAGHVWNSGDSNIFSYIGSNLQVMGATSVRVHLTNSPATPSGRGVTYTITQENSAGTVLRTDVVVEGVTADDTIDYPLSPGCEMVRIKLDIKTTGSGTENARRVMTFYCHNQLPGGAITPCCPPDDATAAQLDLILRMVTLIQRQSSPFAYLYGTNHTALSGDGSIAVAGLIGVAVDVTTLPSSYGIAAGTPQTIFDIGYVNLGTADGWEHSRRIDHDGTLLLPPGAGAFTLIGYSLAPGVIVSIRELLREP